MKEKNSLAEKILLAIKEMADIYYDGLPKNRKMHEILEGHNKHSIVCTLNRLKKSGYIEEVKVDEENIYRLTQKGKVKIFKSFINYKVRWDGKWRIVIFDIPENMKNSREYFRLKLTELGFKRIQNSVWVTPHDVQGVIKLITENLKLDSHVQFIVADHISSEKKLIERFDLKF